VASTSFPKKRTGKARRPSAPNQRATVRYRCPPAAAGRIYVAEDLEFQRAWLQDLSVTGVGLLLSKPLDNGLLVTIHLKSPNSKKSYRLSAHAVHATQQLDGEWMVGCEFETRLTTDELDDLL
jgi:hypothetical protein